ncbi:MAG: alpha/beta hydrolase [Anaerolineae bacterium]|nr:alpha/beta hydrolase [Anaerolineae bacterium]
MNYQRQLVNGHTVHYCQHGQGQENVVLIHGWLNYNGLWHQTMQELSACCTCYALDLPGFGDSGDPQTTDDYSMAGYARLVESFCRQLALKPVTIIGHSMGGMIGLLVALNAGVSLKRLILADAVVTGQLGPPLNLLEVYGQTLYGWGLGMTKQVAPIFKASVGKFYYRDNNYEWGTLRQKALKHATRYQVGSLVSITQLDLSPRLEQIAVPTLVISGEHDQTVPVAQAELLSQKLPQAQLALIPNAAHVPMEEQPELFNQLVLNFIKQTS